MGLLLVVPGLLVLEVARRGYKGTLKRNPLVGMRTRTTMRSDAAWEAAHRASAPALVIAGIVLIVGGMLSSLVSHAVGEAVVQSTGFVVIVVVLVGGVVAQRAARKVS